MIALSTACAAGDPPLDEAVASFRDLEVAAVALHRPATPGEARGLRRLARRVRIEALFHTEPDAEPGTEVGARILVVEGGPAGEDRERSLEDLCRRLHALRDRREVALRTPRAAGHHPEPYEVELVSGALPFVGYWHDAARGGEAYLEAAARWLKGVSLDPLVADLAGLKEALPAGAPVVIDCAPGELREALRCLRGVFPRG